MEFHVLTDPIDLLVPVRPVETIPPVKSLPPPQNLETTEEQHSKKTKLDKKHYCLFCGIAVTKLKRHLLSFHVNEPEMFPFMSAFGKSKLDELKKLRLAGDHLHNLPVLKTGKGNIVVKRNLNRPTNNDDYVPCHRCLGYFLKRDLWRHKCPIKIPEDLSKKQLVKQGSLLLPMIETDEEIRDLYMTLRNDKIKIVIMNDQVIRLIAQRELKKNGHDKDRHAQIRNKLRELGRLLVTLRERTNKPNAYWKEFIKPSQFQNVLEATKTLAGYSPQTKTYDTPGLALKIGHSLHRCCILLKAMAIETKDHTLKADCEAFEELVSIKWNEEVSAQASRTVYQNKKNSAQGIPLSEDVATLSKYLEEQSALSRDSMNESCNVNEMKTHWKRLVELTVVWVIMFNRRRQGEVSKMTVSDYRNGMIADNVNEDVLEGLTKFEKALCQQLKRIEITGKRGRTVPVIFTDEMKASMEILLATREKVGIPEANTYFFARLNNCSLGHIRGCDCLRKLTEEVPLKKPHHIRSVSLRKHIAMLTQLVNLKDNELDVIAQYMGHDIRIHREYYRLPDGTMQISKVAKMLMSLNKGKLPTENELHDDAIEYEVDEESSDDDDHGDNDEIYHSEIDTSVSSKCYHYHNEASTSSQSSNFNMTGKSGAGGNSNRPIKKTKPRDLQRDMSKRRTWSPEEKSACIEHFQQSIAVGVLPGKSKIVQIQKNVPILMDRTWLQIKNFIRNYIEKQ